MNKTQRIRNSIQAVLYASKYTFYTIDPDDFVHGQRDLVITMSFYVFNVRYLVYG